MHCDGCKTEVAARTRTGYTDGVKWEYCDICGDAPAVWLPDMYLGGNGGIQTDENLCGEDGNPIPFQTKREKSVIAKMLGQRQADCAEKQHGARNEAYLHRKKYFI